MKSKKVFFLLIVVWNTFVIYNNFLNHPHSKILYLTSIILLLLSAPLILYILRSIQNFVTWNAFFISIILLSANVIFYFKLVEIPSIATWTKKDTKNLDSIKILKDSPYTKFKKNKKIWLPNYRGEDLTYSFTTDKFGYKNLDTLTDSLQLDYISLGCSFTEGFGVSIKDTWQSQIAKIRNIKVYNAGVQGYAASQLLGTYNLLKEKISHKGIIIGLKPGMYLREEIYHLNDLRRKQNGTGGIKRMLDGNNHGVSFLLGLTNSIVVYLFKNTQSKKILNLYNHEIPGSFQKEEDLINDVNWRRYVSSITKLSQIAIKENKKIILIIFPLRHEIYFDLKDLKIQDLNQIDYKVEMSMLRKTLPKQVEILDLHSYLISIFKKEKKNIYFKKDGHLNEYGNQLVANFLTNYL